MKRPGLYLTILFISIICSTALVSAVISGIAKSFQKENDIEHVNAKTTPSDIQHTEFSQASVKL